MKLFRNDVFRHVVCLSSLLVWASITDAATITQTANDGVGASSFVDGARWSNGQPPSAGNDYVSGLILRTPADTTTRTFAGDSLQFLTNSSLATTSVFRFKTGNGATITVNNLILEDNAWVDFTNPSEGGAGAALGRRVTWAGNVTVNGRPRIQSSEAQNQFTISATISGSVGVTFAGFNSAFGVQTALGTNILTSSNSYSGPTTVVAPTTLVISNQHALANSTLDTSGNGIVRFGGSLTAFTVGGLTGPNGLTLQNDAGAAITLSVGNNSSNTTFNGTLSGPGNVTKIGTGTLTFVGVNSYSGSTTIGGGTLAISSDQTTTGPVTVNDGGTLRVTVSGSSQFQPSTLTLGSSAGATNEFSGITSTSVAPIRAGTLVLNGVNRINISGSAASFTPGSSYPLIQYFGSSGSGSLVLGSIPTGVTGNLSISGNTVFFNVTAVVQSRKWTGSVNNVWDIGTTANWLSGGSPATYVDGASVLFDNTGANTSVSIAAAVAPASVTVSNPSVAYTFSGSAINGAGGVIKTGNGSLTLNNVNTYAGNTVISNGTVVLGVANAIPGGTGKGDFSLVGGTLNLNTFDLTVNNLSGSGTIDTASGGTPTLTVSGSGTTTFNGLIRNTAGTLGLARTGSGTLILETANTFTGPTTISGGKLELGHSNAVQHSTVNLNSANGLTFTWGVGAFNLGGLSGSSGAALTDTGFSPVFLVTGKNNASTTYNGALSGSGRLVKAGTGTLTLTGANAHTGGTEICEGVLSLFETAFNVVKIASITADPNVIFNGGTLSWDATVDDNFGATRNIAIGPNSGPDGTNALINITGGRTFGINGRIGSAGNWGLNGLIVGNLGGTGTLELNHELNIYNGETRVSAGTLKLNGTINFSSNVIIDGSQARFVQANTNSSLTVPVSVVNGTLDGVGTVDTATVSDGTGGIVANGDGTSRPLTVNSLTFNGAGSMSLRVSGPTAPALIVGTLTSGAVNSSGLVTINVTNTGTWIDGQTYTLIQYSALAGQGFANLQLGTVAGLNSRQSAVLQNTGSAITLTISGDNALWTGLQSGAWTTNTVGGLRNWKLQTAGTATEFASGDNVRFDDTAAGTTAVQITDANVTPTTTVFDNSSLNYTVSSSGGFGIASGSVTKNGSGTVVVNTANTYPGLTTVSNGILEMNGNDSLAGTVQVLGGKLVRNSGVAAHGGEVWVGNGPGVSAQFDFSGGTLHVSNWFNIGRSGASGTMNWTNGTIVKTGVGRLQVGENFMSGPTAHSTGVLNMGGTAQLLAGSEFTVAQGIDNGSGSGAVGTVNMTGGSIISSNFIVIGRQGGTGTLNLSGGYIHKVSTPGTLVIGTSGGPGTAVNAGTGILNQSGGAITNLVSDTWIGEGTISGGGSSANGTWNMSGGFARLNVLYVGWAGSFSPSGTLNVSGTADLAASRIHVANWDPTVSGTMTISGSGNVHATNGVFLSFNSNHGSGGGTAQVTLNGGTLRTPFLRKGAGSGVSTLTLNGGSIQATASTNAFIANLDAANVSTGGAVIDDGGFAITIPQALANDPALSGGPDGGVIKRGAGTLTLTGVNTYNGTTVVTNGTLNGTGSLNGPVVVGPSGNIGAGAASIGTLTLNNKPLTLQGNATMRINKAGGVYTSDLITGISSASYGGTLTVSNISADALAAGDQFTLFSSAAFSGNFTSIAGSPGPGLAYSFNRTNGVLTVVTGVASYSTNITVVRSGSSLTLSWPETHLGWILQAQTNTLALGLRTNWVDVAGSSATNQAVFSLDGNNPAVFFRLRHP